MNLEGKWVELEKIILSKVNQVEKDKHHLFVYQRL